MKNIFKKIIASIMAVSSLATGMIGMSVSATDVTTFINPEITEEYQGPETNISFGDGAHASIYIDSTQIILSIEDVDATKVTLKLIDVYGGSVNSGLDIEYSGKTSVTYTYYGNNITGVSVIFTTTKYGITHTQQLTRYVG